MEKRGVFIKMAGGFIMARGKASARGKLVTQITFQSLSSNEKRPEEELSEREKGSGAL